MDRTVWSYMPMMGERVRIDVKQVVGVRMGEGAPSFAIEPNGTW
jgi:hypothetical protein